MISEEQISTSFSDDLLIRVVSETTTFYPPDDVNTINSSKNDNMSLRTTLVYMHEEMNEDFRYLCAGDTKLVFQFYKDILIYAQSKTHNVYILRIILQQIHEILIFLFGVHFEGEMRRNISIAKRRVFAQYVDSYLSLCSTNYPYLIRAIHTDQSRNEVAQYFTDVAKSISSSMKNVVTIVLFRKSKIISRYEPPSNCHIDPETYNLLTLFEKVEFSKYFETLKTKQSEIQQSNAFDAAHYFQPSYIISSDNQIKPKNAFVRIQGVPIACSLSSTQTAKDSPYILLVVTQEFKVTEKSKNATLSIFQKISNSLSSLIIPSLRSSLENPVEHLIYYIIIDRTKGDTSKQPLSCVIQNLSGYLKKPPEECVILAKKLIKDIIEFGTSALMKGYTCLMKGGLDFQFCYSIKFSKDGIDMTPQQVFSPPPLDDDDDFNYRLLTKSLFPSGGMNCIELMSIYEGPISVREVLAHNEALITLYRGGLL